MPYSTRRRVRHIQPPACLPWQAVALCKRFRCSPVQARVYLAQIGGDV